MSRRFHHAPWLGALLACSVAIGPIAAAASRNAPLAASDQDAIRAVITAQLDAFRHDDAAAAYRVASPHIEERFGSAANFLSMVKVAYPAVYRAHDVEFGPTLPQDGGFVQQVGLVGPDGARALALYSMEREANGSWRIDGCMLVADTSKEI